MTRDEIAALLEQWLAVDPAKVPAKDIADLGEALDDSFDGANDPAWRQFLADAALGSAVRQILPNNAIARLRCKAEYEDTRHWPGTLDVPGLFRAIADALEKEAK